MLAMVLAFGMAVVGCDNGTTSGNNPTTPVDRSYTEGDVYVTSVGAMSHYYFSTTPEGIEKAAFDNGITYIYPSIKNATWILNSSLDDNVKQEMNSRGAIYSATVVTIEYGEIRIVVNKKSGSSWYITTYTYTPLSE